ncbi:MAG TPA: hypothetical protein VM487_24465 [Phycisphaerae bacterium]|nr:hypothetical protein [Phycisphaerae bacterium]
MKPTAALAAPPRKTIRPLRRRLLIAVTTLTAVVAPALAQNGVILDQQLDENGKGYTVIRVWGSHYEMGYAQAQLLGDYIVQGVNDTKTFLGGNYDYVRAIMAGAVWMPPGIEDEIDAAVDCLAVTHPQESIDELDLKVTCTAGEWLYGCRSHTCWGRYVAEPIKTLSTRRLDFGTVLPSMNHHVLCTRDPADGSPRWVNLGWAGLPTAATGVNEFGTLVSLHDYQCQTDFAPGRMPRMIACRYALTFASDPDVSTHLDTVYTELQDYEIMTGSFVNYYAPEGYGGVMVCYPYQGGPDFYYCRAPQKVWHHGEAMITTNAWTDGTYTPADENFGADAYYDDESPKTLESHWHLLANSTSLHQLSVAYRGREDMTIWADGRLDPGRTPRLEYEWYQLFDAPVCPGDLDGDDDTDQADLGILLADWGCTGGDCPGDLDDDGDTDHADLGVLLADWGCGTGP